MDSMRSAILNILRSNQSRAFLNFLKSYRARKIEDVKVPSSPEEALRVGFEMGYQQGYGNGLKEGVSLGVDVGMGVSAQPATTLPRDPEMIM